MLNPPLCLQGCREDVRRRCGLLVDDVGVNPEGDRRVGVAESGRDDVDGHAGQEQRRGVDVAKVV